MRIRKEMIMAVTASTLELSACGSVPPEHMERWRADLESCRAEVAAQDATGEYVRAGGMGWRNAARADDCMEHRGWIVGNDGRMRTPEESAIEFPRGRAPIRPR